MVLTALLSNSDHPTLQAAIRAYRALDLGVTTPVSHREQALIPKRAKWLNDTEKEHLAAGYRAGATVYELAELFRIDRRTVALQLKQTGVHLRRQPPTSIQVDQMVEFYEAGQSLNKIGMRLGFDDVTIAKYLRQRGMRIRGAHERPAR